MSVKMGTKFECVTCDSQFIIMKSSPNISLECCGQKLEKIS